MAGQYDRHQERMMVANKLIRRLLALALVSSCVRPVFAQGVELFRRADVNTDGLVDFADVVHLNNSLLVGGGGLACRKAADVNDDGNLDPQDVAHLVGVFFSAGLEIPPPGPEICGPDPTPDTLGCEAYFAPCTAIAPPDVFPEYLLEIVAPGFVEGAPGDDLDVPAEVHIRNNMPFQAWSLSVQTSCPVVEVSTEDTVTDLAKATGFYQEVIIADGGRHGVLVAAAFAQPNFVLDPGRYVIQRLRLRQTVPPRGCEECRLEFVDEFRSGGAPLGNRVSIEGGSFRPATVGGIVLVCGVSRPLEVGVPSDTAVTPELPETPFQLGPFDTGEVGRVLLIELDDANPEDANALYARWGRPAMSTAFDGAADRRQRASQRLVLPFVQRRVLHLVAAGNVFDAESNELRILVRLVDLAVGDVFPPSARNGREVTTLVRGGGFSDATTYTLDHPTLGFSVPGTVRRLLGSARAEVVFDLTNAPPGLYTLTTTGAGAVDTYANAFEVLPDGASAVFEAELSAIARHRRGRLGRLTLRYRNRGSVEVVAPLLKVIGPPGSSLRLEGEVGFQEEELIVLAGNPEGIQDVLSPGASGELAIVFHTTGATPLGPARFDVRVLPPGSDAAIEWSNQPAPPGVPDPVWTTLRPTLESDLGSTWGAYNEAIASLTARLAARGGVASSTTKSFRFAARKALGRASAAIVGQLRDVDGIPLAEESVIALVGGNPRATSVTDFEGRFAIDWLEPGATYTLAVPDYDVGLVERTLPVSGDVLGADLQGAPSVNQVAPQCVDCDDSDLPDRPLLPPTEIMQEVATIDLSVIAARDPNSKDGPAGPGEGSLLGADQEIEYTVFFENVAEIEDPDAAAAAEVVILDVIDPDLDPTTLRFRAASFGDYFVNLDKTGGYDLYGGYSSSTNEDRYSIREELLVWTPEGDVVVRIEAAVNFLVSVIAWRFRTLDPQTLLPPEDPDAGFLPPRDESEPGANEGSVSFTIKPRSEVEEGTEIENSAEITFDGEGSVTTNTAVGTILFEPEPPVGPVPADGIDAPVSTLPALGWTAQPRVAMYDLYLWRADDEKPRSPTAVGLTESSFQPEAPLAPGVIYRWQVVAINAMGYAAGPEWTFKTAIPFVRGDANADGGVDLSDPIFTLLFLFAAGPEPPCSEAGDANGDGEVPNLADAVFLLNWLFEGGDLPPEPAPPATGAYTRLDCGMSLQPGDCEEFAPCE